MWSPNGDRVAFTWSWSVAGTWLDAGKSGATPARASSVDVVAGAVTTFAGENEIIPLRFSPEGNRILYSATDTSDQGTLWSVNIDGSDIGCWCPGPTSVTGSCCGPDH